MQNHENRTHVSKKKHQNIKTYSIVIIKGHDESIFLVTTLDEFPSTDK